MSYSNPDSMVRDNSGYRPYTDGSQYTTTPDTVTPPDTSTNPTYTPDRVYVDPGPSTNNDSGFNAGQVSSIAAAALPLALLFTGGGRGKKSKSQSAPKKKSPASIASPAGHGGISTQTILLTAGAVLLVGVVGVLVLKRK